MNRLIVALAAIWLVHPLIGGAAQKPPPALSPKAGANQSSPRATPAGKKPSPPKPDVASYFPLRTDAKWRYKVDFPDQTHLLYFPEFERPVGLVTADPITGLGEWDQGAKEFEIVLKDHAEASADTSLWNASLDEIAHKFYFYMELKDPVESRAQHQLRLRTTPATVTLDLLFIFGKTGNPPPFQLARTLASLSRDSLSDLTDVSVAAGAFKRCARSLVTIEEKGTTRATRKESIETFLAPNVGIVKAVGKDEQGKQLYSLELTQFSSGKQ